MPESAALPASESAPAALLSATYDCIVIGAGPAGSACAQWLARHGRRVLLADQQQFPRDKTCGDGLIPDSHAALERLGVADEVRALAQPVSHLRCVAPRGGQVDVPGQLAVLPRKQLDEVLRRAAVAAGAVWLPGAKFEGPLEDAASADSPEVAASASARVQGAQLRVAGQTHAVRAPWVVLATGAATQALTAAGMCERRAPTGMALRGYVRHPELAKRLTTMDVVWHRALGRGYGWIFPCRDGVFNIGAGLSQSHSVDASGHDLMADVNLRELFDTFCRVHEPARELMAGGELLGGLKGAPLRCSLEGAKLARPGLLVTGEAAGSTYAFTGEGIGKAMETGLIAAETLLDTPDDATAVQRYAERVLALKPRFDLYERANKVNQHPWLIDLLFWRARRSPRILRRMAGVLEEKGNPGNLVSVKGVLKLFMPLR